MDKTLQDLVWSVLPKEFKEEVKKIYSALLADIRMYQGDNPEQVGTTDSILWERTLGIKSTLCRLFGEHNLTSDAEGEDEMLTVSANTVRAYKENIDKYLPSAYSDYDKGFWVGQKAVFEDLFGSKCLPDGNKECSNPSVVNCKHKHGDGTCSLSGMCCYKSPKPAEPEEKDDCQKFTKKLDGTLEGDIKEPFKEWYDKKYSNVEKLEKNGEVEPKAAEPKFKVGDKVRYKEFVGTVYQIEETDYVIRNLAGGKLIGWLKESDLEPYTEPKEEEASKIKPIESKMSVYLATKEEDEEFRLLLHKNGFKWHTNTPLINLTCWSSVFEDSNIHYVHPDKTVTYCGEKTSDTLTFSEFKKQYFEENVNLSQETAICDKHFDNILKDSFSKERRLNIAAMMAQALLTRIDDTPQIIAEVAFRHADALIAETEKRDKK